MSFNLILNRDVIPLIFQHFDFQELIQYRRVCVFWNQLLELKECWNQTKLMFRIVEENDILIDICFPASCGLNLRFHFKGLKDKLFKYKWWKSNLPQWFPPIPLTFAFYTAYSKKSMNYFIKMLANCKRKPMIRSFCLFNYKFSESGLIFKTVDLPHVNLNETNDKYLQPLFQELQHSLTEINCDKGYQNQTSPICFLKGFSQCKMLERLILRSDYFGMDSQLLFIQLFQENNWTHLKHFYFNNSRQEFRQSIINQIIVNLPLQLETFGLHGDSDELIHLSKEACDNLAKNMTQLIKLDLFGVRFANTLAFQVFETNRWIDMQDIRFRNCHLDSNFTNSICKLIQQLSKSSTIMMDFSLNYFSHNDVCSLIDHLRKPINMYARWQYVNEEEEIFYDDLSGPESEYNPNTDEVLHLLRSIADAN